MVKKGIELVGTSKKNISEAVKNAVKEASLSLRGIEFIRVLDYTVHCNDGKITQHQVRLKVYFNVKR
jgi:flavin-binding protein dodecin